MTKSRKPPVGGRLHLNCDVNQTHQRKVLACLENVRGHLSNIVGVIGHRTGGLMVGEAGLLSEYGRRHLLADASVADHLITDTGAAGHAAKTGKVLVVKGVMEAAVVISVTVGQSLQTGSSTVTAAGIMVISTHIVTGDEVITGPIMIMIMVVNSITMIKKDVLTRLTWKVPERKDGVHPQGTQQQSQKNLPSSNL